MAMTYQSLPAFMVEPTDRVQVGLRRYHKPTATSAWTCADGYHKDLRIIGETDAVYSESGGVWSDSRYYDYPWPDRDDPAWPTICEGCDYRFVPDDEWQEWIATLWRRTDTGETMPLRDMPPGAMWDATWYPWKGSDGRCLVVKCPDGHEWVIDSRASNCTLPDDTEHHCWVRHGDPPRITVDKNGRTCAAGGGSIATGKYHGFLRDGVFTDG